MNKPIITDIYGWLWYEKSFYDQNLSETLRQSDGKI